MNYNFAGLELALLIAIDRIQQVVKAANTCISQEESNFFHDYENIAEKLSNVSETNSRLLDDLKYLRETLLKDKRW